MSVTFPSLCIKYAPWRKATGKISGIGHEYFYLTLAYQCLLPHLGLGFFPRLMDFCLFFPTITKLAENKWKLEASSQMLQWWSWFLSLHVLVWEPTEKKKKTAPNFHDHASLFLSPFSLAAILSKKSSATLGPSASVVSQGKITALRYKVKLC